MKRIPRLCRGCAWSEYKRCGAAFCILPRCAVKEVMRDEKKKRGRAAPRGGDDEAR